VSRLFISCAIVLAGLVWPASPLFAQADSTRRIHTSMPDSLSMKWENGKLVLPNTQQLIKLDKGVLDDLRNSAGNQLNGMDSLSPAWDNMNAEDFVKGKIYSSRKINSIFDSLGIGRMDTLLALASMKEEVRPEDLIKRINNSFYPGNVDELQKLSASRLSTDALATLPPMDGLRIPAKFIDDPGFAMYLISRKLDSLKSGMALDNMDQWKRKYQYRRDSVLQYTHMMDSIAQIGKNQQWPKMKIDSLMTLKSRATWVLDSMANLEKQVGLLSENYNKSKAKAQALLQQGKDNINEAQQSLTKAGKNFKIKQSSVAHDIKNIELTQKPRFWSPFYFEFLATGFSNTGGKQEFQLAPSVGYEIKGGFSMGGSPNFHVSMNEGHINMLTGYRAFAKYRVFKNRGYLQTEDVYYPGVNLMHNSKHNVLAGAGGLIPLAKKLAINAAIFYRVSGTSNTTNWVFRIGISSFKSQKPKN